MNFRKVKQILNRKLIEIWSYRKYTSDEEKNADAISKKIYFIQKIESICRGGIYSMETLICPKTCRKATKRATNAKM